MVTSLHSSFLHYAGLTCRLNLLYCDAEGAPSRARRVKCGIGLTAALTAEAALAVFIAAVVTGGLTTVGLLTYGLLSAKCTYLSGAIGIACMMISRRIFGDLQPLPHSPMCPSSLLITYDSNLDEAERALNTWSAEIGERRRILYAIPDMSAPVIHLIEEYEGTGNEISAQIQKSRVISLPYEQQPRRDRVCDLSKRLVGMCFQYGFTQKVREELRNIEDLNFRSEYFFKYDAYYKDKELLAERIAHLTQFDYVFSHSPQNLEKFEAVLNDIIKNINNDSHFASLLKFLSCFYIFILFLEYTEKLSEMQCDWKRRYAQPGINLLDLHGQWEQYTDACVERFVHEVWNNKVRQGEGGQDVKNGKRALKQLFKEILDVARHSHKVDNFSNEVLKKINDDVNAEIHDH